MGEYPGASEASKKIWGLQGCVAAISFSKSNGGRESTNIKRTEKYGVLIISPIKSNGARESTNIKRTEKYGVLIKRMGHADPPPM